MQIHKAGYKILATFFIILGLLNLLIFYFTDIIFLYYFTLTISAGFFVFCLAFFRVPDRQFKLNSNQVIAPADGKIVVVEEAFEDEYLKEKRIQVSIFMSVWNVHINWYPVKGIVSYFKYHPGLFLYAWLPKSSTENERTTIVVETPSKVKILLRQIAGAVARRIETYAIEGQNVEQLQQMGFIKFGSRVDVFLPLDAKILVKPGEISTGGITVLAELN